MTHSRILAILLALGLACGAAAAVAGGGMTKGDAAPHGNTPAVPFGGTLKVDKASGPDAHTIGELYARAKSLDGKKVSVRGKVVKVSKEIMGKNWIHLRDGSGDPEKRTHNVVVTSKDAPAVGDVVTAHGLLAKDKDFGSGYRYEVIIEEARVK